MHLKSRIDVLEPREQEQIKQTMLTMLHEVGIFVECQEVVASLKRHGYRMDGQRLKPTPEETLAFLDRYAHAPTRQATIPRDTMLPAKAHVLGLADVSILDWETKRKRRGCLDDARRSALFVNGLENTQLYITALPGEIHPELAAIAAIVESSKYTAKVAGFGGGQQATPANIKYWEAMGCVVAGGMEAYLRNPHLRLRGFDMSSPMKLSKFCTDRNRMLMKYKRLGGAVTTLPLQGLTGMVTLAGCVAQSLAETIGGGLYMEMVEKEMTGSAHYAFRMSPSLVPADLRFMREACSAVENTLGHIAIAQMQEYLGLPVTRTNYGSGKSESKWWDVQDGFEKMLNRVFPLLAGLGWGALGEMATNEYFSFEQALLDLEMIGMGNRMIEGVRVDGNALDVEVFRQGVAAGLFAGLEHTAENYRAELYLPQLASRDSYTQWDHAGRRAIEERAHARVEEIIRTAEPQPKYPPDVQRDLEKLLAGFQREFN